MRGTTSSVGVVGVTAWRHFWNKASPGRVQGDKLQNMAGIIEKIWLDDQLNASEWQHAVIAKMEGVNPDEIPHYEHGDKHHLG